LGKRADSPRVLREKEDERREEVQKTNSSGTSGLKKHPLVPQLTKLPMGGISNGHSQTPKSPSSARNPPQKIIMKDTLFDNASQESSEWNKVISVISKQQYFLSEISFIRCGLTDVDHVIPLLNGLANCRVKLSTLQLEGNFVSKDSMTALASYLIVSLDSLEVLNIRKNNITDEGVTELCLAVKDLLKGSIVTSTLRELDFSGNHVSDVGFQELAQFCKLFTPNLSSLKLFGNYCTNPSILKVFLGDTGCKLKNIDFWKNSIQVEGLSRFILVASHLTSLNLGYNNLGDRGMVIISKYLSSCTTLRR